MLFELFRFLFSPTFLFTFLLGLILNFYYKVWKIKRTAPPGPWPLPLLGSLLVLRGSGTIYEKFTKLSEKYGNFYSFWMGGTFMIICSEKEIVREVLWTQQNVFADRDDSIPFNMVKKGSQDIALAKYGPLWKLHRKLAMQSIRKLIDKSILEEICSKSVKSVTEGILKSCAKGKPFEDMNIFTSWAIINVISSFCYGKWYENDDEEFKRYAYLNRSTNDGFAETAIVDILPFSKYVPWRSIWPRFNQLIVEFSEFYDRIRRELEEHRPTYKEGEIRDFLDAMIYEQNQLKSTGEGDKMTDDHIIWIALDFFSAGTDTTNILLGWFFLFMVKYPDIQERCYQEIKEICGDHAPKLDDRLRMPYLESCINESLRMRPPAPLGIPHKSLKDTKIGPYEIPAGTLAWTNISQLHLDNNGDFGPDATEFHPSGHWLESDGKGGEKVVKRNGFSTFGGGKRICMGEQLARNDAFLLTTGILQKLKLCPVKEEKYSLDPDESNELFMYAQPYKIIVEKR